MAKLRSENFFAKRENNVELIEEFSKT